MTTFNFWAYFVVLSSQILGALYERYCTHSVVGQFDASFWIDLFVRIVLLILLVKYK